MTKDEYWLAVASYYEKAGLHELSNAALEVGAATNSEYLETIQKLHKMEIALFQLVGSSGRRSIFGLAPVHI